VYAPPIDNKEHYTISLRILSDDLQLPWHLGTVAAVHVKASINLMEGILIIYHKSLITHKLNVSMDLDVFS
jgi:hypothetical protein